MNLRNDDVVDGVADMRDRIEQLERRIVEILAENNRLSRDLMRAKGECAAPDDGKHETCAECFMYHQCTVKEASK